MNDRQYQRTRRRLERSVNYWLERMCLRDWTTHITYHRTALPDMDGDYNSPACITVRPQYRTFHLELYVAWFWQQRPGERQVDSIIIHELHHAHLAELRTYVPDDRLDDHLLREEHANSVLTTILESQTWSLGEWGRGWEAKARRWKRRARKAARRAAA